MAKGSAGHDKRTLVINAAANWLGFATGVVATFVVCPIYVRTLGDESYGIWSLVESVVAYFTLLDMGIGASVLRYVAKFDTLEDRNQLNRVFSTSCAIFIGMACLVLTTCAGVDLWWENPFGVEGELVGDVRWLLLLLGCNVAVELVAGVFGAVLLGLGRFPTRVAVDVVLQIGGAFAMVFVLSAGYGLLGIGGVCLAVTVVKGCLLILLAKHYLPHLRFSPLLVGMESFRLIRGYSFLAFIVMIAGRVSLYTSSIVIGAFLSPEHITYYVIGARLVDYVKSASRSITNVLTPAISSMETLGNIAPIRRLLMEGSRYVVFFVLPFEIGLFVLGKPFLTLWLGGRLADSACPSLVILSVPLFLSLSQCISGRILYGVGRLGWFTIITVSEAVINLLMSIALVKWIGIEGVALATTIPTIFASLGIAYFTCRMLSMSFGAYIVRSFGMPLLIAPVAPIVWLLIMHWHPITNWTGFVLIGGLGTLTYGTVACAVESRFSITTLINMLRHVANSSPEVTENSTTTDS